MVRIGDRLEIYEIRNSKNIGYSMGEFTDGSWRVGKFLGVVGHRHVLPNNRQSLLTVNNMFVKRVGTMVVKSLKYGEY